jgi:hypothetical protein
MTGPRNLDEMREALRALNLGPVGAAELEWLNESATTDEDGEIGARKGTQPDVRCR